MNSCIDQFKHAINALLLSKRCLKCDLIVFFSFDRYESRFPHDVKNTKAVPINKDSILLHLLLTTPKLLSLLARKSPFSSSSVSIPTSTVRMFFASGASHLQSHFAAAYFHAFKSFHNLVSEFFLDFEERVSSFRINFTDFVFAHIAIITNHGKQCPLLEAIHFSDVDEDAVTCGISTVRNSSFVKIGFLF